MSEVKSTDFLRPIWICWKIVGATKDEVPYKIPYIGYSIMVQIFVTLCYPLHLSLGLFSFESSADNIKNLTTCITCTVCSLKYMMYTRQMKKVLMIESLLDKLDLRIKSPEEKSQFEKIRGRIRGTNYIFLVTYVTAGFANIASFIFKTKRESFYPAWFPFDWEENTLNYAIANMYQIGGLSYQILQNYIDDCLPAVWLCLLSGHTQLLATRVSKIGSQNKDVLENERELLLCIQDQKNLYKLFDIIQDIISLPMFIQFAISAANICIAMAAIIFYVKYPFDMLYNVTYFLIMPMEIFPTCYYGSEVQLNFGKLHYSVFSSNWTEQTRTYKKHMLLFAERSLKLTTAFAGGMVRIHLDTFFSTCRGAYSLFAVIMRIRN